MDQIILNHLFIFDSFGSLLSDPIFEMQRTIDCLNSIPAMECKHERSAFDERVERRSPWCFDLAVGSNDHTYKSTNDLKLLEEGKVKVAKENASANGSLRGKIHRRGLSFLSVESALTTTSNKDDGKEDVFNGLTEGDEILPCRISASKRTSHDELGGTAHSTFSSNALPLDVYLAGLTRDATRRPVIVFDNAFMDASASVHRGISGSAASSVSTTSSTTASIASGRLSDVASSRWDQGPATVSDIPAARRNDCPPAHPRWSTGDFRRDTGLTLPFRSQDSLKKTERSIASPSRNSSSPTWWYGRDEVDTDSAKFRIRKQNFARIYQRQAGKPTVGRKRNIRRNRTIG